MIKIDEQNLAHILLCSFRYSLGRMTYIVSECVEWLECYWHLMPPGWKRQIQGDIRQAIASGHAGHDCDVANWKRVLALPLDDDAGNAP